MTHHPGGIAYRALVVKKALPVSLHGAPVFPLMWQMIDNGEHDCHFAERQMSDADLKKRYRWQCRRGLKEVDVVLNDYLDLHFDQDDAARQALFGRLLEEQDADLFEWFTERSAPGDTELAAHVRLMLERLRRPA
jgi:antitoxin CptB